MAWPFSDRECPSCAYLLAFERAATGEDGYQVVGMCRHPSIATELFLARSGGGPARCPCFFPSEDSHPVADRSGEMRDEGGLPDAPMATA